MIAPLTDDLNRSQAANYTEHVTCYRGSPWLLLGNLGQTPEYECTLKCEYDYGDVLSNDIIKPNTQILICTLALPATDSHVRSLNPELPVQDRGSRPSLNYC